jgi:hypothetical protein
MAALHRVLWPGGVLLSGFNSRRKASRGMIQHILSGFTDLLFFSCFALFNRVDTGV